MPLCVRSVPRVKRSVSLSPSARESIRAFRKATTGRTLLILRRESSNGSNQVKPTNLQG